MVVADLLARTLEERGTTGVRDLVAAIRAAGGHGVSRRVVERTLEGDPRFVLTDPARAEWALREVASSDTAVPLESSSAAAGRSDQHRARNALDALDLRPWQATALAAWSRTGRGVVEAVTGAGKTRLAMAAIQVVVATGGRALVLVPTIDLQDQWIRGLRATARGLAVGRLGGGGDDDLYAYQVVVATPQSASDLPIEPPPGTVGLLVADEAHRYGAPTWGAALRDSYAMRLALTATYERNDDGVDEVLGPYFGEVIHRYGYAEAARDGTIAPFRIAVVTTPLTTAEQQRHDRADTRARQLHRELVGGLGMPSDPSKLFAAVAAVVAGAPGGPGGGGDVGTGHPQQGSQLRACREYLVRVRERRETAANAASKIELCRLLAPSLARRRTLVFTDTVDQADAAATMLRTHGRRAETLHGGLESGTRRARLAQFRTGAIEAIVAPRVLDEGVDVPDADVAVVLAAFRTRRQMVQRLGRVLRVKADGRAASLVVAAAAGTLEDPDRGGHRAFLGEVEDVALAVDRFTLPNDDTTVATWLSRPGRA